MRTKTDIRRVRFPAQHSDATDAPAEIVFEEEDEAPCSKYIVMSQERELPALREYLRECCARTIH